MASLLRTTSSSPAQPVILSRIRRPKEERALPDGDQPRIPLKEVGAPRVTQAFPSVSLECSHGYASSILAPVRGMGLESLGMIDRVNAIGFRIFGAPPPKDAPRSRRLRWVRRFYLRLLPLTVPVYALVLVLASQTWVYIPLAVATLLWLEGLISISLRIRREQRREST